MYFCFKYSESIINIVPGCTRKVFVCTVGSGVILVVVPGVVFGKVVCLVVCIGGISDESDTGFHGLYNDCVTYGSLVDISYNSVDS